MKLQTKQRIARASANAEIFYPILQAFEEKFSPIEVWQDEEEEPDEQHLLHQSGVPEEISARLVFELAGTLMPRAVRYVDLHLDGDNLTAQSSSRESIRVNFFAPGSLEEIEKFITEHFDGTRRWR